MHAVQHPELYQQTDDDEYGGLLFEIKKGRLSFRLTAPYCNERRKAAKVHSQMNSNLMRI